MEDIIRRLDNILISLESLHKKIDRRLHPGSVIAKLGYRQQLEFVNEINSNEHLRKSLYDHGLPWLSAENLRGISKTDVIVNSVIRVQIKRIEDLFTFRQIGRYWKEKIIERTYVSDDFSRLLKDMSNRVKLKGHIIPEDKHKIIKFALFGRLEPNLEYLVCVTDSVLLIFRYDDLLQELTTANPIVRDTTIHIGFISIQRKGGDSKMPSANQIQFKIVIGKIKKEPVTIDWIKGLSE